MSFKGEKREKIKLYILEKIADGQTDFVTKTAEAFETSLNTIYRYVRELEAENVIRKIMTIIITALITFIITSFWLYGRIDEKKIATAEDGEAGKTEKIISDAFESDSMLTKLNLIRKNKYSHQMRRYTQ